MKYTKKSNRILGWVSVTLSTLVACIWAFWGIIENFHEGWYYPSLWQNMGLMIIQYLSPMLIFIGLSVISILWPRIGGVMYVITSLLALWFFQTNSKAAILLIILPFFGLGIIAWYGRPHPKKWAVSMTVGAPMLILIISGLSPAIRISQRLDDGILQARHVQGNGILLVWAPEGPGWPVEGTDWYEARKACLHLSENGKTLIPEPQGIWSLPTVDEAVRSMALHGENSGGTWDERTKEPGYQLPPDKESPLWNVHTKVIYWWTATEIDREEAYIIAYDGKVWPRSRDIKQANLGFRCVKKP